VDQIFVINFNLGGFQEIRDNLSNTRDGALLEVGAVDILVEGVERRDLLAEGDISLF
jgi:hypothetical protein